MTRRVKLIRIKTRKSLDDFSVLFHKKGFSVGSEYGFLDVNSQSNEIKSTYVEMEKIHQDYIDPLGERYEQTFVSYNVFEFSITTLDKGIYLLSICNPPKSIKKFIERLSSYFEYEVTFSMVVLNLNEIIHKLLSNERIQLLHINKLKASGLKLNDTSTACIDIISKGNAVKEVETYANGSKYTIDKIKGQMYYDEQKISFEMSKSGLISINNEDFNFNELISIIYV
ncbi:MULTISPECIES: hypothetical protein [Klebsiella/Raoultella group]|uniref:hypothetical protein n=1 Tax=Klebsiella/Raoultella group TaxID=2890311 RepID=UPI000F4EFDAF|nr:MULTISPECIES: hypothetical protein [Klebsiella/Raoultella group]AYW21711.1 hypothetical protein DTA24_25145 [Klebsiella sp. P1CD1]MBW3317161.1 hypothetical protein [Klebsiella pneumoniae]MCE0055801.1 hypothetical protein [Klebsiella pneumoniae]MCW9417813.1 hypothetical protein [Klebsiella quasipneumoniae]MEB7862985.1 hypothetical protein [Raoultella ornithinolytica]